ncbi:MAG: hypothetical protein ACRDQ7_22295 [Haloechinothrix sp.]
MSTTGGALAGLPVLDLSRVLAGPTDMSAYLTGLNRNKRNIALAP